MGQCHSLGETLELWQTDGVILQYAGLMMLMMLMLIMFVDVHDVVDVDVDIDVWMINDGMTAESTQLATTSYKHHAVHT